MNSTPLILDLAVELDQAPIGVPLNNPPLINPWDRPETERGPEPSKKNPLHTAAEKTVFPPFWKIMVINPNFFGVLLIFIL
jgi:hypothetical protein